jgi:hypothetical protein
MEDHGREVKLNFGVPHPAAGFVTIEQHTNCGTDACCEQCEPVRTHTANEIETFSGNLVDTGNPSAADIVLEDIAHALSMLCRFGGHASSFYSVAAHAVFVSRLVEERLGCRRFALHALHHDDAEAYLGDLPRPFKLLMAEVYGPLSDKMDAAIGQAFGLNPRMFHDQITKNADNEALLIEAAALMPSKGINWAGSSFDRVEDLPPVPDYWPGPMLPIEAEGLFLSRHWELV